MEKIAQVIDCGANIGPSSRYFSREFLEAPSSNFIGTVGAYACDFLVKGESMFSTRIARQARCATI